jgi:tripartite-type tricarboxylate transporter receptor subunit TctC
VVLSDPKVIASIDQQGATTAYTSRKEFAEIIKRSNEVWKKVVEDINFEKL